MDFDSTVLRYLHIQKMEIWEKAFRRQVVVLITVSKEESNNKGYNTIILDSKFVYSPKLENVLKG